MFKRLNTDTITAVTTGHRGAFRGRNRPGSAPRRTGVRPLNFQN